MTFTKRKGILYYLVEDKNTKCYLTKTKTYQKKWFYPIWFIILSNIIGSNSIMIALMDNSLYPFFSLAHFRGISGLPWPGRSVSFFSKPQYHLSQNWEALEITQQNCVSSTGTLSPPPREKHPGVFIICRLHFFFCVYFIMISRNGLDSFWNESWWII